MQNFFDLHRLLPTLHKLGLEECHNLMRFWLEGHAAVANRAPKAGRATVGQNINAGLRIYTLQWKWINRFYYAKQKYQELIDKQVFTEKVKALLINHYTHQAHHSASHYTFNDWLQHNLPPGRYCSYIRQHQLQHLPVLSFELNHERFDDMVGALGSFAFYVFYRGGVINAAAFNALPPTEQLSMLQQLPTALRAQCVGYLRDSGLQQLLYVKDVGIYAGKVYDFNSDKYIATWDIVNHQVDANRLDAFWSAANTDADEDLIITQEVFRTYRDRTRKGGDFIALSPVRLEPKSVLIPTY